MAFGDSMLAILEENAKQRELERCEEITESNSIGNNIIKIQKDCAYMKHRIPYLQDQLQTMARLNHKEDLGIFALHEYITRALGEIINLQNKTSAFKDESDTKMTNMQRVYKNCRLAGEEAGTKKLSRAAKLIQNEVESHYPDLPSNFWTTKKRGSLESVAFKPRQTPWPARKKFPMSRIVRQTACYPNIKLQAPRKTLIEVGQEQTGIKLF